MSKKLYAEGAKAPSLPKPGSKPDFSINDSVKAPAMTKPSSKPTPKK